LVVCCLLTALCACGGAAPAAEDTQSSGRADPTERGEMDRVLRTDMLYPLGAGASVTSVIRQGQTLLIAGEANGRPLLALADYSLGASDTVTLAPARYLALDEPDDPAESRVAALCAAPDGDFYVLTGEYPAHRFNRETYEEIENPEYAGRFAVLRYDANGVLQEHIRLEHWPHDDAVSLAVDADGALIVCGLTNVALLDRSGKILHDEQLPDHVDLLSSAVTEHGVIVCLLEFYNFITQYCLVDGVDGHLTELPLSEESAVYAESASACQGLGGEYLLCANGGFYVYDFASGGQELLMTWQQTEYAEAPASVCRLGESCFLVGGDQSGALTVYRYDYVPAGSRQTLRVACVGEYGDGGLTSRFNNESLEYRCDLECYTPEETSALLTAIAAGDCPDLVLFSGQFNTASNAFDDLYPYLDADPELNRDSFLPNLLPALETGGEVHELWPGAVLYTLYARRSDVGDGFGLTTADYARLLDESDARSMLFEPYMTPENLLAWLAVTCTAEFIDRETGVCRFDAPGFVELLEWCAEMSPSNFSGEAYIGPDYTRDDVLLFFEGMQTPLRVHNILQAFPDAVFVGFPGGEGSGSYYDNFGIRMAIPRRSACKDGAWAFIRSQFTTERQMEDKFGGMPVTVDAMHRLAAGLSSEELQILDELLAHTTKAVMNGDDVLRGIILDGGQAFLSGDKSAGEAAALIQSRAAIYLAEQYG